MNTTIIAPATAMAPGAIGIVRISGPKALAIAKEMTSIKEVKPRYAHFVDVGKTCLVDKALFLFFKGPNSFTGEDVVEFHLHGNPHIMSEVIEMGIGLGAVMAQPGEFSKRAFLNGQLSLDQVEAIADIIHAKSSRAARSAVLSLDGALRGRVEDFQSQLMALRVLLEASIDFVEEDIPSLTPEHLDAHLKLLYKDAEHLHEVSSQGAIQSQGIRVCLVGRPNAGKSTLMNAICKKQVSIVTPEAGTTRDVIEREVAFNGHTITFLDTAGLRKTENEAEAEGVLRANQLIQSVDLVLLIHDATDDKPLEVEGAKAPVWTILNKVDLLSKQPQAKQDCFAISAKEEKGVDQLLSSIVNRLSLSVQGEAPFSARKRHVSILERVKETLKSLNSQAPVELLAHHLFETQEALSEITGVVTCDDVLGEIFSDFCIGK